MDSKTLTTQSQLFCNLGLKRKRFFSCHISWFCFPFSSDEQEPLIYYSLSFCLQTHRELDRIADSERRRYGALHWTTETVSVDAVIWRGAGRDKWFFSVFWSYCVADLEKDSGTCTAVNPCFPSGCPSARRRAANGFPPRDESSNSAQNTSGCGISSNASGFNVRYFSECDTIRVNSQRMWQGVRGVCAKQRECCFWS